MEGYNDALKPVFKSTPSQFQTIIFATVEVRDVGEDVGDVSKIELSERQRVVVELIKKSPAMTGRQLSETLSVTQRTIERDLASLKAKGLLKRKGKDNGGLWEILDGFSMDL